VGTNFTMFKLLNYEIYGDCVPMSCDNGKTWCVEYDFIKNHPEFEWKTWFEVCIEKLDD
jgi:hypothetical protein